MNRPVAIFDVDGTQFKSACVEKVIDEAITQDLFDATNFESARDKRRLWQADNNEGVYQSYLHHLVGGFVTSMAGVEVVKFEEVIERMVKEQRVRLFSYTRKLAELLKPSHELVAISGSPEVVVAPFLDGLGFDRIIGSSFEVVDGHFTGQAKSIKKEEVLSSILPADSQISVGVGDTIGDLAVLERAICPIAFNPSATLRRQAIDKAWPIVMEQKDAVTQLLPAGGEYRVSFERSPTIVLDAVGIKL